MVNGRCNTKRALALLSVVLVAGHAAAQTYTVRRIGPAATKGYEDVHISKAAIAGQQVRLWAATLLNADCTPAGTMTTRILAQPHHGRATISDDQFYPTYIAPNPRAACDARKAPGKQAFYTADPAFHGHDKLILQNATSEGWMRRIIIDIDIR